MLRDGRVHVAAQVRDRGDAWAYGPAHLEEEGKPAAVPLVPFRLRATRGPAAMRVWLPVV
ncbi:hypothetical protein SAMN05216298_0558 [Glycomyces sambucus]|uniref:Uncharacterized protein n=1 Tax=Glycomyces sambucus TaxID=380244 RepID=A0A1G9CX65_9ACTN|nr:hypothetical protein [Glycomyces sambucus]SDK56271.1 hypothetical protein SAMN05216298_0558 [Glycomyces sambucus]